MNGTAAAVWGANNVSVQLHVLCRGFKAEWPSQSQWITIGISYPCRDKRCQRSSSGEGVTLSSHLSSKLVTSHHRFHWDKCHLRSNLGVIFLSACGILANGRVLIGRPLNVRVHAVDHAKFKTTKIYSQGILVHYTKICTNKNFSLYGTWIANWYRSPKSWDLQLVIRHIKKWSTNVLHTSAIYLHCMRGFQSILVFLKYHFKAAYYHIVLYYGGVIIIFHFWQLHKMIQLDTIHPGYSLMT